MKRILLSLVIITALSAYVATSTYASYSKGGNGWGKWGSAWHGWWGDNKKDDRHDDGRDDRGGGHDDKHDGGHDDHADGHDGGGCDAKCAAQLLIGNTAYYNGARVPLLSWDPVSSLAGKTFFAFADVKPDDRGGNGIAVRVKAKDTWACMEMSLTKNDDAGSTEPELVVDTPDDPANKWDGELAQALQMLWWADDGDHVFEQGERVLGGGVKNLFDLASSSGRFVLPLADSTTNAWGKPKGTPLRADTTYTLGTAWCLGTLTPTPQSLGNGKPFVGITPRGQGVVCDGTLLSNVTQTDTLGLTLTMRVEEAQGNASFRCTGSGAGGPVFTHGTCKHFTRTGVRYHSFMHRKGDEEREMRIGADVDVKSRRTEREHTWTYGSGSANAFTFTYDKARDTFTSTMGRDSVTHSRVSNGASCPVGKWNVLEVKQNGERAGAVVLRNVRVNGKNYGTLGSAYAKDSWTLSGLNLSQGFTVTGEIVFANEPKKGGAGNDVEIVVGCE